MENITEIIELDIKMEFTVKPGMSQYLFVCVFFLKCFFLLFRFNVSNELRVLWLLRVPVASGL